MSPKNDIKKILIIKEEFVELLGGDVKASLVLSYLYYWQKIKSASVKQSEYINIQAEKHGDSPSQYTGHLHYHKTDDIYEGTFGLIGKNLIPKAIKKLEDLGILVVTRNPNPQYTFDNTKWFFLDIKKLEKMLKTPCKQNTQYEQHEMFNTDLSSQRNVETVSTKRGDGLNETWRPSPQNVDNNNKEYRQRIQTETTTEKSPLTPQGERETFSKSPFSDVEFQRLLSEAKLKAGRKGAINKKDIVEAYEAYKQIEDKSGLLDEFVSLVKAKGKFSPSLFSFILDKRAGVEDQVQDEMTLTKFIESYEDIRSFRYDLMKIDGASNELEFLRYYVGSGEKRSDWLAVYESWKKKNPVVTEIFGLKAYTDDFFKSEFAVILNGKKTVITEVGKEITAIFQAYRENKFANVSFIEPLSVFDIAGIQTYSEGADRSNTVPKNDAMSNETSSKTNEMLKKALKK